MLDAPHIMQTTAQQIAVIRLAVPRAEIQHVLGPGLGELRAVVAAQGLGVAGPWFTHHLRIDPGVFDFEIGVPVAGTVAAVGRVRPGEWPAMTVARTVYHGAFEGLGAAWGEFDASIAAEVTHHARISGNATSQAPSQAPTRPPGAWS